MFRRSILPFCLITIAILNNVSLAQHITLSHEGERDGVDFVTEQGNHISAFRLTDSTFTLKWNVGAREQVLDKFHFSNDADLFLKWENEFALGIEAGCGSSCWYTLILPLNEGGEVTAKYYPLAYDIPNNLVAYIGRGDTLLYVENFVSQSVVPLKTDSLCGSAFNGDCLVSAQFVNGYLKAKWFTDRDMSNLKEYRLYIRPQELIRAQGGS